MNDAGHRAADAPAETDADPPGRNDGAAESARCERSKVDVVLETGLTPERFVLEEIESRGPPVKQQAICEFTGWTDSCVSRLLTDMEDAGTIARVRIGREKFVFRSEAEARAVTARLEDAEPP